MKARNLFLIVSVAAIVGLGATNAGATCVPGHAFSQWDGATGAFFYSYPGADANQTFGTGGFIGRWWQGGAFSTSNNVTCPVNTWFIPYAGKFYVNGLIGGQGCGSATDACPTTRMVALVQTTTLDGTGAKFAVGNAAETGSATNYFFYGSNWNFTPIPRPGVTFVGKAGSVATLNLTFADMGEAFAGPTGTASSIITGYRLVRSFGVADAGRAAANYTFVQRVPYAGGSASLTGFQFDCATAGAGNDVFFGVQVEFENGQFNSDYVGATTRVKCNSTQADPQFRKIDKTPKH